MEATESPLLEVSLCDNPSTSKVQSKVFFSFNGQSASISTPPRTIQTGLQHLHQQAVFEQWSFPPPFETGKDDMGQWIITPYFCLHAVSFSYKYDEVSDKTEQAYSWLLHHSSSVGMQHVVRTWNYLPAINQGEADQEVYKQFCQGRARAYLNRAIKAEDFAAASALGTQASAATIYQLSTKNPGQHFENPLQISAYQYPRRYGPESPSFARATIASIGGRRALFLSGTASVEGHLSIHPYKTREQTKTTISNINHLLGHVAKKTGFKPEPSFLKVYVRNTEDLKSVAEIVERTYGCPSLYLKADICRRELMVEIDGHCWI